MGREFIITDKQLKLIVDTEKNNSKKVIADVPQKKEGQVFLTDEKKKGGTK